MAKRTRERYWVHSAPDEIGEDLSPCARGVWCLDRAITKVEGHRVVTPAMTPRAFCEADDTDIAAKLPDLPKLCIWLMLSLREQAKGTVAIRVPFGPSVPIRIDVDALLRLTVEVLVSWHGRVAEVAGLTVPDLAYTRTVALTRGYLVARRSAKVLEGHLTTLLGLDPKPMQRPAPTMNPLPGIDLPDTITTNGAYETHDLDGAWAGNEVIRLHHLCRAVVGDTDPKPERLVGVPCKQRSCDAFTLRRAPMPEKPDDTVYWSQCDACGDVMTEDEYKRWTRRYAIYANSGILPDE